MSYGSPAQYVYNTMHVVNITTHKLDNRLRDITTSLLSLRRSDVQYITVDIYCSSLSRGAR
jgi:hypothetical protein